MERGAAGRLPWSPAVPVVRGIIVGVKRMLLPPFPLCVELFRSQIQGGYAELPGGLDPVPGPLALGFVGKSEAVVNLSQSLRLSGLSPRLDTGRWLSKKKVPVSLVIA